MFSEFTNTISELLNNSGFIQGDWKQFLMILIACVLIYLAIVKKYEPLLLLPISFGMLIANIPMANLSSYDEGGLIYYLYQGVKLGIYPPLIFLGIGAMTDFGPLIANPKSLLLGAAAQLGIFTTFIGALILGYTPQQAGAIGIIGGADGPTAIFVASKLAPDMLGAIAIAAYSYMALVPIIQPPIMKLLTTKKERSVVMSQLRPVSKLEKVVFPIIVTILVSLFIPNAAPLVGMLMLGNLFRESGVVERLNKTAQNELINIITIFLGVSVGATATADRFLNKETIGIVVLGLAAFSLGTAGGVLFGKIMYWATGGKVNPLIGSAGVSAVPMAARVSQKVGQEANPSNFLLMHAMGPNVAGVIGSAVAAGILLSILG
ncbi:MAG: sodium ion-translocating decarboxylase subunit beta [Firmicutes bacterium]|nr:sodium ion-translocating decarboxylase subunit beta [Bacillota bacterium]